MISVILRPFCLILILPVFLASAALGAPPDNDNFANRRVLVGSMVEDVVDNADATVEFQEPGLTFYYPRTVWWTWTAPANGILTVQGSHYCAVWSGNILTNLVLLGENRLWWSFDPVQPIRVGVAQGQTFQISGASIARFYGEPPPGPIQIDLDLSTVHILEPTNGQWSSAGTSIISRLSDPQPEIDGSIREPVFIVQSTRSRSVQIFRPSETASLSGIITNLTPDDYFVSAQFKNGANHLLSTGTNLIHIRPANDDFAAATEITGLPFGESLNSYNAGDESGEPTVPGQLLPGSLWWRLDAPQSGELWIGAPAVLGVFTGEQLNALTLKTNGIGFLRVSLEAGQTYYFKAAPAGFGWDSRFQNSIFFAWVPSNDDFESRQFLGEGSAQGSGLNAVATTQAGEPAQTGTKTLWWSWTAPASGLVSWQVSPVSYIRGAVWQGESLTNLTLVTDAPLPFSPGFLRIYQFQAREGQTYHLSMGNDFSLRDNWFSFTLDLCTMRIVEPEEGARLLGPTNLAVRVTPPNEHVEGAVDQIVFHALSSSTSFTYTYAVSDYDVRPTISNPFSAVFTNLPPERYVIYAHFRNRAGRVIATSKNSIVVRPYNDDFASAAKIPGLPFSEPYELISATDEPGEPVLPAASVPASVWWRWTAPKDCVVVAEAAGGIGAFTGRTLQELEPVGYTPNSLAINVLRLPAKGGTTYFVKVTPFFWLPWKGALTGTFRLSEAWANDDFKNRIALDGGDLRIIVPAILPSNELGEPLANTYRPNPGSLWWTWTAPKNGLFLLELVESGSGLPPLQQVFSGHTLATLVPREFSDTAPLTGFGGRVKAGEKLQIALNAGDGQMQAVFRLRFFADPPFGGLGPPVAYGDGTRFLLQVKPKPDSRLVLETSYDLLNWNNYMTLIPTNNETLLIGPIGFDAAAQFFRVQGE